MTCCQAVRELRSTVTRPVPVAALMHMNSASTNVTGNFPLLPQRMRVPNSGTVRLEDVTRCQREHTIGCDVLTMREGGDGKSSDLTKPSTRRSRSRPGGTRRWHLNKWVRFRAGPTDSTWSSATPQCQRYLTMPTSTRRRKISQWPGTGLLSPAIPLTPCHALNPRRSRVGLPTRQSLTPTSSLFTPETSSLTRRSGPILHNRSLGNHGNSDRQSSSPPKKDKSLTRTGFEPAPFRTRS